MPTNHQDKLNTNEYADMIPVLMTTSILIPVKHFDDLVLYQVSMAHIISSSKNALKLQNLGGSQNQWDLWSEDITSHSTLQRSLKIHSFVKVLHFSE